MFCEEHIFSLQLGTSPYLWKREGGGGAKGGAMSIKNGLKSVEGLNVELQ